MAVRILKHLKACKAGFMAIEQAIFRDATLKNKL